MMMEMQAYMLGYEDSVELAKFELSTNREKAAFMGLIRKKAHMVLPVDEVPPPPSSRFKSPLLSCLMVQNNTLNSRDREAFTCKCT